MRAYLSPVLWFGIFKHLRTKALIADLVHDALREDAKVLPLCRIPERRPEIILSTWLGGIREVKNMVPDEMEVVEFRVIVVLNWEQVSTLISVRMRVAKS